MHLTHIKIKPTKVYNMDFDPTEALKDVEIPKESIEISKKYLKSKQETEDYDFMLFFENHAIFGFEFLKGKEKYIIPEISPTTIFYSNAVMSHRKVNILREEFFEKTSTIKNFKKPSNPNLFGVFFQLATNCIINLQSTLESFVNSQIPDNYKHLDKDGKEFEPSVFHKLDKVLPKLKEKRFKTKFKQDNLKIRLLIELRNELIHLKPSPEITNTKYEEVYKKLLKFDFTKSIFSVKKLVNFYEPNLIEECKCDKELYYEINEVLRT